MVVAGHLGTRSPCRRPRGRRRESSDRVESGQGLAELDQTDPYAVSSLGQHVFRSMFVPVDPRAYPTIIGKVRDVVANVGGELPGAAVHGGLLHRLGLAIAGAESPRGVIGSYVLGMESAASRRRSASSTSISPR